MLAACSTRKDSSSQNTDAVVVAVDTVPHINPLDTMKRDKQLDALGRFMAGMNQLDSGKFSVLEKEKSWQEYKTTTDSNWNRLYRERLGKIQSWEPENLGTRIDNKLGLFYPFSGPDYLHAHYLFPSAPSYTLVGLEPIADIDPLDTLTEAGRKEFLDSLGHSLRDVFRKSFFETNNMRQDFKKVRGVLPLIIFFLERTDHELVGKQFLYLDPEGQPVFTSMDELNKKKGRRVKGVRVDFRDRKTLQFKQLYYFSQNVINDDLKRRPEFGKFLARKKPFNTFIKSASYLMHRDTFTEIKRLITDNSQTVFQDDTGIPYKEFASKMGWDMQFYGDYIKPIKLFESRYQPDLDSAFKAAPERVPLPFNLGYHYGSSKHNYMLAKKAPIGPNR